MVLPERFSLLRLKFLATTGNRHWKSDGIRLFQHSSTASRNGDCYMCVATVSSPSLSS